VKKLEKMHLELNEKFREEIIATAKKEFEIDVINEWGAESLITKRSDGMPLTTEQHAYLKAYSEGYAAAMRLVEEAY
jgi:hypothetical protein